MDNGDIDISREAVQHTNRGPKGWDTLSPG